MKNFGEFYDDQISNANCIVISHTSKLSDEKISETVKMLRENNSDATIITTDWNKLSGASIIEAMEQKQTLKSELSRLADEIHAHHHHDDDVEHEHHQADEQDGNEDVGEDLHRAGELAGENIDLDVLIFLGRIGCADPDEPDEHIASDLLAPCEGRFEDKARNDLRKNNDNFGDHQEHQKIFLKVVVQHFQKFHVFCSHPLIAACRVGMK